MSIAPPPNTETRPAITCDWEEWREFLEHVDASDEDKRHMIEMVFAIVVAFVDLGWEIGSKDSCGQNLDLKAALTTAVLNSDRAQEEEEV
jgi:hypothetical protein